MAIYFLGGPIILLSGGQAYQEINCLWPNLTCFGDGPLPHIFEIQRFLDETCRAAYFSVLLFRSQVSP